MEKSKVYFTDFRTRMGVPLTEKLQKLIRLAGIESIDFDNMFVAIKMHFGELGNLAYLRPNYAKAVADVVKENGGMPFLTDCNTLYPGSRKHALEHMDCANMNGFNTVTTGCQIIIGDGLRGTDDILVPVPNGEYCKEAYIGRAIMDADIFISLTHFKGHTAGGFGGSNKNIGIGCADGRIGKAWIHTTPGQPDQWDIMMEELMERISESTKASIDFFGKHVTYVNVMRNMSVSCDCEGVAAEPVVTPNVGILSSTDILAIDQACIDIVFAMKKEEHNALVERIVSRHGLRQLSYMKELGMGNDRYILIDLDNGCRRMTVQEAVQGLKPFVNE